MQDSNRDDRVAPNDPAQRDEPIDPYAGPRGAISQAPPVADEGSSTTARGRGGATAERRDVDASAPRLTPAVLGRLEGLGVVTLLRDASGSLMEANGTWRPADESASLEELRETFPEGSVTTFAGATIEAHDDAHVEDVSMQVVITRHGEYVDDGERVLRVVNFVPRDGT